MMRSGGQPLVESLTALGATEGGALPDLGILPEALAPRQALTRMRQAALAAKG